MTSFHFVQKMKSEPKLYASFCIALPRKTLSCENDDCTIAAILGERKQADRTALFLRSWTQNYSDWKKISLRFLYLDTKNK